MMHYFLTNETYSPKNTVNLDLTRANPQLFLKEKTPWRHLFGSLQVSMGTLSDVTGFVCLASQMVICFMAPEPPEP